MVRFVFLLVLGGLTSGLWAGPWTEDWAGATKQAAASGKPLLVKVTGSDWCPPCQIMEAEVFDRPEFQAVGDRFVLVTLDFPRNHTQVEKVRVQNTQWVDRNPIEGFPTYFVIDAQGTILGRQTGLVNGGVPGFDALVRSFFDRGPALALLVGAIAKAPSSTERAKAEDALFRQAEAWDLTAQYGDLPMKIVRDDADGKAGLKKKYQTLNAYSRFLATWANRSDYRQAAADLDALATQATPWPDLRQKVVFTKGMVLLNALDDEAGARTAFRQARELGNNALSRRAAQLLDSLP